MARTPQKRTRQSQGGSPSKRARVTRSSAAVVDDLKEEAERARALLQSRREEAEGEGEEDDEAQVEDVEEEDDTSEEDTDPEPDTSPTKSSRGKRTPRKKRSPSPVNYLATNASDAYFLAHSSKHAPKPTPASQKSFSSLPQLSALQVQELLALPRVVGKHALQRERLRELHSKRFSRWAFELEQGFNILLFGWGSKRDVLDSFARDVCTKRGHVATLHAYLPNVSYTNIMASLLSLPFVPSEPAVPPSSPAAVERLYHALSASPRPLYIILHSLDTPGFLTTPLRALLSLLALHPKCHLLASVDKVNAPLLFTQRDLFTRKHEPLDYPSTEESHLPRIPPQRGFAFLWQEATTFEHYTAELAPRASLSGTAGPGVNGTHLDLTATIHILNSVPDKSKTLFTLLGKMQLENLAAPEEEGTALPQNAPKHAAPLASLLTQAREAFIATNEVQFRALLAEFRDHGLVSGAASGAQEVLWVNVNKSVLQNVLQVLEEDG